MSGHHYDPLVAMSVTFGISYEQTPWNKNWDPPAFPLWREENLLKESESWPISYQKAYSTEDGFTSRMNFLNQKQLPIE